MNNSTRKRFWPRLLLFLLFILIIVGAFLISYTFPHKVDVTLPAMEYHTGDTSDAHATTIRIKGTVSHPLFRDTTFNGDFIIDGYDYTQTYKLAKLTFYKHILNGMGTLVYTTVANGASTGQSLGMIWMSNNFEQLNIQVYESNKPVPDLRISAPAQNLDEALLINKKFEALSNEQS